MSEHKVTYGADRDGNVTARCDCTFKAKPDPRRWRVEDQVIAHRENVERMKAALSRSTPGLKSQARYFRKMADDPEIPKSERELWDQLAVELEQRIAEKSLPDDENQPPLF
jgi:hypothetical protein